jgi:hypothetical protein
VNYIILENDRPDVLNQEKPELFNNAANQLRELIQDYEDRLTFENIAKCYLKAKIWIVIALRAVFRDHSEKFFAVFERAGNVNESSSECVMGKALNRNDSLSNKYCGIDRGEGDQQPMLVNNVQSVQPPEGIIPSLVRFEDFNQIERRLAGTLQFSNKFGLKSFPVLENGESGRIIRRPAACFDQLPSQVIETGAEIVNGVPNDERNAVGRRVSDAELYDSIAGLQIIISDRLICVGFTERPAFGTEVVEVLFGPFDLR